MHEVVFESTYDSFPNPQHTYSVGTVPLPLQKSFPPVNLLCPVWRALEDTNTLDNGCYSKNPRSGRSCHQPKEIFTSFDFKDESL